MSKGIYDVTDSLTGISLEVDSHSHIKGVEPKEANGVTPSRADLIVQRAVKLAQPKKQ